jgi:flagellar hook assembly protein FlgD
LDGKLVRRLILGNLQPGSHSVSWDGRDHSLSQVPSGIYIYRLQSEHHSGAGKMTLLK